MNIAEEYPILENGSVAQYLKDLPQVLTVEKFATRSAILKFETGIKSVWLKGSDHSS